ncbi:anti-repressor SinI family protein [Domibacillus indicus]|nr:anti-repressor SinI family protein [Domibacillus indicus]
MDRLEIHTVEEEWVSLLSEAKQLGLSVQDIREFLKTAHQEEHRKD